MKKAWFLAFLCALASIPVLSQPQSTGSFDLAAILNPPTVSGPCAPRQSTNLFTPLVLLCHKKMAS
jgi:hypothetical protein